MCLCLYVFICVCVCPCVCLCVCLRSRLIIYILMRVVYVYMSIYLSVCLHIFSSIYLSIYLSTFTSFNLSIYLFIYASPRVFLSITMFVSIYDISPLPFRSLTHPLSRSHSVPLFYFYDWSAFLIFLSVFHLSPFLITSFLLSFSYLLFFFPPLSLSTRSASLIFMFLWPLSPSFTAEVHISPHFVS